MIRKITLAASVALLAGCGGGDINIEPTNIDNSVDNSVSQGGGANINCASYADPDSGNEIRGQVDGNNCVYGSDFVGASNPLTVDLVIPRISGVHIFEDSLFVGENVSSGPAPAAGTGPTLTIRGGNTLAFLDSGDYMLVNRGSTLNVEGAVSAPVTLTAFIDAVAGTAGPEDVQLWGGVVINGNGITNNCTDAQRAADDCHVLSEGQPSNYGGSDNTESSGTIEYLVVKHTGFEVAPGDELNGVSLNAIGSGTTINHAQVYSTFDDGYEFFGGAVQVDEFVALYARDDSIDFSDGWIGGMNRALVIHSLTDGNRCVEGDNIGEGRADGGEPLDFAPVTSPTLSNLTCILSSNDDGTHGDSEGITLRRGPQATFENVLVYSGYGDAANSTTSNECFELDDDVTRNWAENGQTTMTNSLLACGEATKDSLQNGEDIANWVLDTPTVAGADYSFNSGNVIDTLDGGSPEEILLPGNYITAGYSPDADETTVTLSDGTTETFPGVLGAVQPFDDWTATWTFGLKSANQAQPLYFATP